MNRAAGIPLGASRDANNKTPVRQIQLQVPDTELTFQVISPKEAPVAYFVAGKEVPIAKKTAIAQTSLIFPLPKSVTLSLVEGDFTIPLVKAKITGPDVFLSMSAYAPGKDNAGKPLTLNELNDIANAYYAELPQGSFLAARGLTKTNFLNWQTANGFLNGGFRAKTIFFNACDLGVGRMVGYNAYQDPPGTNNYAFFAVYYPTVDDAVRIANPIAIAAMEYIWNPTIKKYITTFYVFALDGRRVTAALQDDRGFKPRTACLHAVPWRQPGPAQETENRQKDWMGTWAHTSSPLDLDS